MKRSQSIKLSPALIKKLIQNGQIPADAVPKPKANEKPLREDELYEVTDKLIHFVVGVRTASEANERGWRLKSGRTSAARKAVCRFMARHARAFSTFAEHWRDGGSLKLSFTRVGCRALDQMANLGHSLKACEDAVALWLGADDGDPLRWRASAHQEPEWKTAGVAVKIEKV